MSSVIDPKGRCKQMFFCAEIQKKSSPVDFEYALTQIFSCAWGILATEKVRGRKSNGDF
jgi:hypothetical protein